MTPRRRQLCARTIERPPLGTELALKNAAARRRRLLQSSPRDRTVTDEHPNAYDRSDRAGPSRRKSFSATELAQEALRFAEAENPKTNALLTSAMSALSNAAKRVDRADCRGRRARAAGRCADRGEGCDRHQRSPHHLRLQAAGELHPALRRDRCDPAGTGRRRHHRQDQLRRIRDGLFEREFGVRAGAESC